MSKSERYTPEQALTVAETLKPLAVLSALQRLGFNTTEAVEYARTGDPIDTEGQDYVRADEIINRLDQLIDAKFGKEFDLNNNDIGLMPGYQEIKELADRMGLSPTLEGTLLFKKQGHGRVRGAQPPRIEERDVAYFSFVQTVYGRFYVRRSQEPRGNEQGNINEPVLLRIKFVHPFKDSRVSGRLSIINQEEFTKATDNSYPPKSSYIPWRTLLGAMALHDAKLSDIGYACYREQHPAREASDIANSSRQAILNGAHNLKDWYHQKLLDLDHSAGHDGS